MQLQVSIGERARLTDPKGWVPIPDIKIHSIKKE
jgi:hypothetical protein